MMKKLLAIFCLIFLWNYIVYSQDNRVFNPDLNWLTIEEARNVPPDSVFHLTLKKEKLSGEELPEEIFQYRNLKSLSLRGTKITTLDERIVNFTQLTFLDLGRNRLPVFPVIICRFQFLETLVLHRNSLNYIPAAVENLQHLKHLDLWETPVMNLPEEMEKLPELEYVDMRGINMNPETQEQLKKRFPQVKLELDPPCNCFR